MKILFALFTPAESDLENPWLPSNTNALWASDFGEAVAALSRARKENSPPDIVFIRQVRGRNVSALLTEAVKSEARMIALLADDLAGAPDHQTIGRSLICSFSHPTYLVGSSQWKFSRALGYMQGICGRSSKPLKRNRYGRPIYPKR